MRHVGLSAFIVLITITAGSACSRSTRAETSSPDESASPASSNAAAVPVSVATVVQKAVPVTLQAIGTVEAATTVGIQAQVTGQLNTVEFTEGDNVRAGDVLFRLDSRTLEATVKQAEANLQRDQAQEADARAQAGRAGDLAARGIVTAAQLETARASADALTATIAADQAALANARLQVQYATITAPISGRTGSLLVHAGSLVRANDGTPLVVINQITPINVSFAIPEDELSTLRRRMSQGSVPVTVSSPDAPDTRVAGTVTFVDNAVDLTTGTIKIKGSFPNRDRQLWPGQFVNVTIELSNNADAIVIPSVALQTGQQGTYVFVIRSDKTAELRPVVVARTSGNETIVASGLQPDETVVTDGHLRLVAGSTVSVKDPVGGAQ